MHRKILPCLGVVLLASLTGCSSKIDFLENLNLYEVNNLADKKELIPAYRDGFNILQLTDLHWGSATDIKQQRNYLKKLILETEKKAGKIDLIEIAGDSFMLANTTTVIKFIETFEEIGIPYAPIWGNHDRQGVYNPNWFTKQFENAKHCLYSEVNNDNLSGRSNYVLNIKDGETTKWQIFHVDSGASYRENATTIFMTYDYIRSDQLQWLEAMSDKSIPSLAYYHISQRDHEELFNNYLSGKAGYKAKFFKYEGFGASDCEETPRMEPICVENKILGVFVGHCHSNDLTITTDQGVTYGFGVKSGSELYYATVDQNKLVENENVFSLNEMGLKTKETFDLIGASLVTLHENTFDLHHLYLNERATGDLVEWVKY